MFTAMDSAGQLRWRLSAYPLAIVALPTKLGVIQVRPRSQLIHHTPLDYWGSWSTAATPELWSLPTERGEGRGPLPRRSKPASREFPILALSQAPPLETLSFPHGAF
jgi:hypothetical protein